MTVPFTQYLDIKDKYCMAYFGDDKELLYKILEARDHIEKELKGLKVFIACKDDAKSVVHGKRNIILENTMPYFKGKIAHMCTLEKKEDLKSLLIEAKITIPEDF
jgi:hypothetical protein